MRWLVAYLIFLLASIEGYAQHRYFSGGDSSTVFLCQDGHVYVSGKNGLGQLGRGLLPGISTPDIVSGIGAFGTLSNIKQVSGKQFSTLIALSTGGDTVVTWGNNSNGQLGNNLYGNQYTNNNRYPYRVVGVAASGDLKGIAQVAMGTRTAYALTNTGKVVSWGSGNNGALGNGTNGPDMTSPVYVIKAPGDTLKTVIAVSGGEDCAFALLADGTVWAWGLNIYGQLGQNTTIDSYYAVQVKGKGGVGYLANIVRISSSETHILALSSKDTLWAWGRNNFGQLGNNTNVNSSTPIAVLNSTGMGPLKNVTAIAADLHFSMALRKDSTVSVWGNNAYGQFGNNTLVSSAIPTKVLDETGSGSLKNITGISSFSFGGLVRRANGDLLVWGDNDFGQLGLGDYTDRKLPVVLTLPCTLAPLPVFSKGTVSGPSAVCTSSNSGTVTLSGHTGSVIAWHSSTNNFSTYTVTPAYSSSFAFSNITQKTSFRAVIQYSDQIGYSDSLVVQLSIPSLGGTLGSAATVCASTNSGTLTMTGGTGLITGWESSVDSFATAGTPISNMGVNYTYTNLTSTEYYRVVVKNGGCPSAYSNIIKITVDPVSAGGSVSSSATVCAASNGATLSLTGNTGNVLRWESSTDGFVSAINTIVNTTGSYTYTNLGTTTGYRVVVKSGVCSQVYSSVATITVDPVTTPGTLGSAATVCSGTNSGTLSIGTSTGAIMQWESSPDNFTTSSVIANITSSYSYSNLTASTYYRVLLNSGTCPAAYSNTVKITVDSVTVGGTVSPGNTVCFGTNSGTMNLSGKTGAVVRWEYSSDNFGSFTNTISNATTTNSYSNLTVTTYYRAVVQSGVCPSAFSTVNIIYVDPVSSGGALTPTPATVCSGSNSGTVDLASYVGTVLNWETSTDNFASVINTVANTTATMAFTNMTATTYYRVKVQSGVCPPVYSPIATVNVTPVSVGGTLNSSTSICSGSSGPVLSLTMNTGSIVRWEYSTDGFVADINFITNTNSTYSYPALSSTTQFRVHVKNGICPGIHSSVATITVDVPSVVGTLTAAANPICSGSAVALTLGGPNTGAIVQWEYSTDNFVSTTNPIVNTTTTHSYSNLTTTTSYRVRVKNGACASITSNIVKVNVDPVTVGGVVGTSSSECSGTNGATLTLSGHFGAVLHWESSTDNFATVTTIANVGTSQGYSNLTATTQYRAVVQSGVCPSQNSTSATITIYPVTVGGTIDSPDTVCFGFNNGTLNLVGPTGNIVHWESSTDNFVSNTTLISNNSIYQGYNNLVATTYYRVLVKNGSCASQYSSIVEITVNPHSVGGTISASDTVCTAANGATLRLSGYLGVVMQWETSTDNFTTVIVPVNNTTDTIAYSNLTETTYYRAQIQNTGCAIAYPSPAVIKVDPVSAGGTLTAPAVVCANSNSGVIRLVGYTGEIVRWESSPDNFAATTIIVNKTDSLNYLNLANTTYYRAFVRSGKCTPVYSNSTAVTVNPAASGGTIVGAKNVCVEGNAGSLILINYSKKIVQWETSTDNFLTSTILTDTNSTFNYTNIITPVSVRALVAYSPCPPAYSDVFTFIVNPSTNGGELTGNSQVQKGEESGPLTLVNFTGGVLEWEYSADTSKGWTVFSLTSNVYSFPKLDTSTYVRVRVKSGNCPDKFSVPFYIRVINEINTAIKIYPTISPNADNINDEWIIDNIALYPSNRVKIFNRWGDMVYEERGYDNGGKVWRGNSNTHFTALGHELPEGTYFYIVDPGNGMPEFSGYVVLNR